MGWDKNASPPLPQYIVYLWLAERLEWIEEKAKPLLVVMAWLLYVLSLLQLVQEIDLGTELSRFLVEALANLSIPYLTCHAISP